MAEPPKILPVKDTDTCFARGLFQGTLWAPNLIFVMIIGGLGIKTQENARSSQRARKQMKLGANIASLVLDAWIPLNLKLRQRWLVG